MEIFKQKFTRLQKEILSFLFINAGKTYNQKELANNLDVSSTAISKSLKDLKGLIKIRKKFMFFIELNTDNPRVIQLKRVDNLKNIYSSGLCDFLSENFPGTAIILFGSYSYGEDTFESDIDIAITSRGKSIDLSKYENILKRKINLHFLDLRKTSEHLRDSILNGIVLKGFVE